MQGNDIAVRRRGRLDVETVRLQANVRPDLRRLVDVVTNRAARWVANDTLVVPGELGDWWHLCWERLSDVAFAEALSPDRNRAAWLRAEVLRLCDLPGDEWIGPFFRPRYTPTVGMLETAHVGLAVATVLELCPDLLTGDQAEFVHQALREKCLLPCERALVARESGIDVTSAGGAERLESYRQNWYWVLLDAFGAVALLTDDRDRIATLPERFNLGQALHNADSYGESVQYWGYAAIHLTNLLELIDTYRPDLLDRLDQPQAAMMPWLAHAVMFAGQSRDWGPGAYTTMVNFGDSAYTARPPADALSSIARHSAASDPQNAGLARWLLEATYSDPVLEPTELSSFGFFNQIGWRTVVNLCAAADSVTAEEAGLPLAQRFETGTVAVRDRWSDPTAVLAAQTGHSTLNVDSHRHDDYGSFVLGFGGEVFFTDPGHCCYRLQAYHQAVLPDAHSTWTLRDGSTGQVLPRTRPVEAAVGRRFGPTVIGDAVVFGVDLADLYPGTVRRAQRTWIGLLPHLVLIVDDIDADIPITVESRFVVDNRDNRLTVNQASTSRLVFRRGSAAAKFFRLLGTADGRVDNRAPHRSWSAVHDIYQPQPNAPTQGREGSGVVYTFSSGEPATACRSVYSIVLSAEADIRGWHVQFEDGTVTVVPPDGPDLVLRLSDYVSAEGVETSRA